MWVLRKSVLPVIVCAVLLVAGSGLPAVGSVSALAPAQNAADPLPAPYGAVLTDRAGNPVADGAYDFEFALYASESGGTPVWSEAQSGVPVRGGAFTVRLGATNSLPAQSGTQWLGVRVRGSRDADYVDLLPRTRFDVAIATSPASPAIGPACAHDHVGETWNAAVGWSNAALKINNSLNGPSIWGVNTGGGNALRADAYGASLGLYAESNSGAAIVGRSSDYRGVEGYGLAIGVRGEASGSGSGVVGISNSGAGVFGKSNSSVGVYGEGTAFGVYSKGDARVDGNLIVTGSKSGYVVDIAQNDDTVTLEAGDVVVISGAGPAVLGEIPVIKVRRASAGEESAVAGIVDQRFLPGARASLADESEIGGARAESAAIAPGEYLTLVTLGAFQVVKVDAAYGAIEPGDLLVASPHAGHAMRADSPAAGTVLGKALAGHSGGTGAIPVLVTLH